MSKRVVKYLGNFIGTILWCGVWSWDERDTANHPGVLGICLLKCTTSLWTRPWFWAKLVFDKSWVSFTGSSKASKQLFASVFDKYFGKSNDLDNVGFAQQLLHGKNAFSPMFDIEVDIAKGTHHLSMKSCYHCLEETIICSKNPKYKGINIAILL